VKKPVVFLASVLTLGVAVPAHAFVFAVGDYLLGGSWGQKFRFESSDASNKRIEKVRFTLYEDLSSSRFESSPRGDGVLRGLTVPDYQERSGFSSPIYAEAEKKSGEQGSAAFDCQVWFDDPQHPTSPSDVAFQCEIESKDSSGHVDTERLHLEFRDKDHDGSFANDNWECNELTSVPEPATTVLLGLALGAGGLLRWRRFALLESASYAVLVPRLAATFSKHKSKNPGGTPGS